jgi:hypothetical protein
MVRNPIQYKNETLGAPTHVYKVTHKKRHAMRIRDGQAHDWSLLHSLLLIT